MAGPDGSVHSPTPAIAKTACLDLGTTRDALRVLAEPDEFSRTLEAEGRRITFEDDDGERYIHIINFEKYRSYQTPQQARDAARKRKERRQKREKVEKKRTVTVNLDASRTSKDVQGCPRTFMDTASASASASETKEETCENQSWHIIGSSPPPRDLWDVIGIYGKARDAALGKNYKYTQRHQEAFARLSAQVGSQDEFEGALTRYWRDEWVCRQKPPPAHLADNYDSWASEVVGGDEADKLKALEADWESLRRECDQKTKAGGSEQELEPMLERLAALKTKIRDQKSRLTK